MCKIIYYVYIMYKLYILYMYKLYKLYKIIKFKYQRKISKKIQYKNYFYTDRNLLLTYHVINYYK